MNLKYAHDNITTLLDIVCCVLIVYFAAFMVAFIQMAIDKQEKKTEAHAEIQIVVTWPEDVNDDVDTYVEDPSGRLLSFSGQDVGLMALDRDDRGRMTDIFMTADGRWVEYKGNREIVTLRGLEKGEYCVNVQMFSKRSDEDCPVQIVIEKMNPRVTLIAQEMVILKTMGDDITVCRFTVTIDGNITNVNRLQKDLARRNAQSHFGNPYPLPSGHDSFGNPYPSGHDEENPSGEDE